MEPEPELEPESELEPRALQLGGSLGALFGLELLQRVLELLTLWEVGRIGVAVNKHWAACVHAVFKRQLASAGRDVRVAGLDAAHPLAFLAGTGCRVIEPNDAEERAELLKHGCVKIRRDDLPASTSWSVPLTNLRFITRLGDPLLEAAVRAEVTQQHRGKTLTKAGHLKGMTVVALQPCLPFSCHRCGARPEDVTAEHPQGKPQPGRQKWWQALKGSADLECIGCLILAAIDAGLDHTKDDLGMFQWQRCMGVMEFFAGVNATAGTARRQQAKMNSNEEGDEEEEDEEEDDDDDDDDGVDYEQMLWPDGLE